MSSRGFPVWAGAGHLEEWWGRSALEIVRDVEGYSGPCASVGRKSRR